MLSMWKNVVLANRNEHNMNAIALRTLLQFCMLPHDINAPFDCLAYADRRNGNVLWPFVVCHLRWNCTQSDVRHTQLPTPAIPPLHFCVCTFHAMPTINTSQHKPDYKTHTHSAHLRRETRRLSSGSSLINKHISLWWCVGCSDEIYVVACSVCANNDGPVSFISLPFCVDSVAWWHHV